MSCLSDSLGQSKICLGEVRLRRTLISPSNSRSSKTEFQLWVWTRLSQKSTTRTRVGLPGDPLVLPWSNFSSSLPLNILANRSPGQPIRILWPAVLAVAAPVRIRSARSRVGGAARETRDARAHLMEALRGGWESAAPWGYCCCYWRCPPRCMANTFTRRVGARSP